MYKNQSPAVSLMFWVYLLEIQDVLFILVASWILANINILENQNLSLL